MRRCNKGINATARRSETEGQGSYPAATKVFFLEKSPLKLHLCDHLAIAFVHFESLSYMMYQCLGCICSRCTLIFERASKRTTTAFYQRLLPAAASFDRQSESC